MKNRARVYLFLAVASLLNPTGLQGFGQSQYYVELKGLTWDHTVLRTLIVPQVAESWWSPSYLNATLEAVDEWNHAIQGFSSQNASLSYLAELGFRWEIGDSMAELGYDIYLFWTRRHEGTELGTSTATYLHSRIITKDVICLAVETFEGLGLSETDVSNVALHELGHALGLGHSNKPKDVMAPSYELGGQRLALSNLDLYGVSESFRWVSTGARGLPPQVSYVSLAESEYVLLPTPTLDLSPQSEAQIGWDAIVGRLEAFVSGYLSPALVATILATMGLVFIVVGVGRELRAPRSPAASNAGARR